MKFIPKKSEIHEQQFEIREKTEMHEKRPEIHEKNHEIHLKKSWHLFKASRHEEIQNLKKSLLFCVHCFGERLVATRMFLAFVPPPHRSFV